MYFSFSEKCIVKRGVFFFLKFKGKTILFSQVDVHYIGGTIQPSHPPSPSSPSAFNFSKH